LFIIYIGITNAYNFMDGINGITGFYSLSILVPLLYTESNDLMLQFLVYIIMAIIVFLYFNARIKARCFAGDIGSISMALIILFVVTEKIISTGQVYLIFTLLLYGLDSIFTIFQRLWNRENIFEAHRKHLYQYLVNEYKLPHLLVSGIYGILQLLFNFWILISHPPLIHIIITVLFFATVYVILKYYLINRLKTST
jgi:UDP-GlcNAc:undecaprenyl-phosphate GlcNAc-1-phosphate transferase